CLTAGFIILGRTVVLDSLLTACVVTSWGTGYMAIAGPRLHRGWWVVSALACGLGVLAKGPVALVLVVPPLVACRLLVPSMARPRLLAWCAFLGLLLLLAGPWYAAMAWQEPDYLKEFLWKGHVQRFMQGYIHAQPWWFYLPVLIVSTFPWCFLWPALIYFVCTQTTGIARLRTPGLGFAVLSLIWWILFYSASGSKSPPYMLPTLVPLALVLGACLAANWRAHGLRFHWLWTGLASAWPRWTTTLMLAGLVGCALATALLEWQGWTSAAAEMVAAGLLLALWLRFGRHAGPRLTWGICAAAILAFNLFAVQDLVAG